MQRVLNIARRDPFGIERDDLVLQLVGAGLVLVQQRWLKVPITVPRHLDGDIARRGPQVAAALAVAAVAGVAPAGSIGLIAELGGEFRLQHVFKGAGKQPGEEALLAKEVVDALCRRQFLLNALHRRNGSFY